MISAHLKFEIANQPITSPVTKLGGRPIWIDEPAWPRSRSSGNLMFFIGQVELDRQLFPLALNDMAYLFMTDDWGADLTWDPNAGENAIIFQSYPNALRQPFNESCASPRVIERDVVAHMTFVDEPPFATASERDNWSDDQRSRYWKALRGCKVGGSPLFIQDEGLLDSHQFASMLRQFLGVQFVLLEFFVPLTLIGILFKSKSATSLMLKLLTIMYGADLFKGVAESKACQ